MPDCLAASSEQARAVTLADGQVMLPNGVPLRLDRLDALECELMKHPAADCPVHHTFTPGLYSRSIYMPAGSIVTSKIHLTAHQYVVSQGVAMVMVEGEEWVRIAAPYLGITKPGTKRVLVILEDMIWTTFHPTELRDVDEIERTIIFDHREHLAGLVQPPAQMALSTLE